MAKILDLDEHRKTYPLPCVSGEPLRWHIAPSSRFCTDEIADHSHEDWQYVETYPVIEYVANAENGCQYTITFESKSGTFEVLHTNISRSGVLLEDAETLQTAKDIAEKHRLSLV